MTLDANSAPATFEGLWRCIEQSLDLPREPPDEASPLADHLGVDSIALLMIAAVLDEHGVELADDDWADIHTVGDLWFHYQFRRANPVRR